VSQVFLAKEVISRWEGTALGDSQTVNESKNEGRKLKIEM
jgi:hypothetical protein